MKRWIAYLSALILAVSCMTEVEQGSKAVDASLEGGPVTITFSVPDIPVLPATKTLETGDGDITDTPYLDPDKMYLVVCGNQQSIKYIRKAKLTNTIPDYVIPQDSFPLSEGDRKVTLYKFQVQLELSDIPRTIHILGNVDENQLITGSYSYDILPNLLSYENKQAYWQKLYVPHIKAQKDPDTQVPIIENGCYVPDDETAGYFRYIPLIRNFAKIQVSDSTDNFHLHSYAVIYYPERGSVVPYRSNETVKENRFDFNPSSGYRFSGYETSSFGNLEEELNYPGNMPAGVALDKYVPKASEFEDPRTSNGRVLLYKEGDTESGFYIYERGIPTDKIDPTFIIICGKFEDDDNLYYYRLDLMETKAEGTQTVVKYYPIYRNFRYNIELHRISSEGVGDPESAVNSSGADDISADVSMRHLSDISNGTTRLVVEPFMTRTYSGPAPAEIGTYYLYARFFDDVFSDVPNIELGSVKVELEPMEDGNDILILYDDNGDRVPTGFFFLPSAKTVGGLPGVRTIRFNTIDPQEETKTQKIKITGHKTGNNAKLRLYREVEITLQQKQPLRVSCADPVVPATTNTPVVVGITIPSELPESMFPLEFIVEPEDRTLTPDTGYDINMPVRSGKSIATTESVYKDTPAFYYLRTLTREEYLNLSVIGNERTFYCYFKTNRDFNATTIWVYNEFFNKDHKSYENKLPMTLTCTNPVLAVDNTPIVVTLTINSDIPYSYFPLSFIIEPEVLTFMPDLSKNDLPIVTSPSIATDETPYKDTNAEHFIKTLTWDQYTNLPVIENKRTFNCYFNSTTAASATTIWAYNKLFYKAHVSFENKDVIPDNHFWVYAVENCKVKINYNNLWYKIDDGGWIKYSTPNTEISLTAGQKISFKGGSKTSKMTRTTDNAFKCTGGKFKVGGNFASLMVGDDYPKEGAGKTGDRFINFFKEHTNLIDAYDLILPMTSLGLNAYKSMFDSCNNLERGPENLPAMKLGETCYRNMFYGCSSLIYAPTLPATDIHLVKGAYQRMFWGCSSLSEIRMFGKNWRSDTFISIEKINKVDVTHKWCDGVASSGDIYLDSSLENAANWDTTWGTIMPAGWTPHYVNQ